MTDSDWDGIVLVLSGSLAPLSLLPEALQTLAAWTPFPWMVSFPVELLLGRVSPGEAAHGLGLLALWIAIGCGVVQLTWRRASARYSAVGA